MTVGLQESISLLLTPALFWAFPLLLGVLAVLFAAFPSARRHLKAAALLAVSAAAGLLLAATMRSVGADPASALFRTARGISCFLLDLSIINTLGVLVFDIFLPRLSLTVPALLVDLIHAIAYLLAALAVLSDNGVNLTGIIATSAVMTAIIAFSLQETLGNVIGGMVLHLERSLAPGDMVRLGDIEGTVRQLRWRQTTIETGAGDTIIVPNSALMKDRVVIIGRRGGQPFRTLRAVSFGVYYDRAPNAVIECVERALRGDPPKNVASDPPPQCLASEFADGAIHYTLRYWLTDNSAGASTDSLVRSRLYYALAREGIKLSNPSRSVVVVQKDEDVQGQSRDIESGRRMTALKGVDIFAALSEEELNLLSWRLKKTPFSRDEILTKQGAKANWLYILDSGEAEVRLSSGDGAAVQAVATLRAGDFMGEMGLMTGEPRSATVVALTDVGCYRLDRDGFTDIISRRPEIAESISLVLAKRRVELEAARGSIDEQARRERVSKTQAALLTRIRGFFSLA